MLVLRPRGRAASLAKRLRDATLLVNVSNVAWFGDSLAPGQHLQIARKSSRPFGGVQMLLARLNGSLYLAVLITATIFAAAIGLFFGMYPAYRAAALHPIDALRYE